MKKACFLCSFLLPATVVSADQPYPSGARSTALGTATVTLNDAWCTLNNPSGLGSLNRISSGISYENRFLVKELNTRCFALTFPVPEGTLGFSLVSFGYPLYLQNRYALAFGKSFSNKFSLGIALNYLHTHIPNVGSTSIMAGEMGMQVKLNSHLLLGVDLFHPVSIPAGKHYPALFKLGINYSFSRAVSTMLETEKQLSKKPLFKAGIEYQPVTNFFLRIGIATDPVVSSVVSSFGIGFTVQRLQIDLAVASHQALSLSPQLSLLYSFGKDAAAVRSNR
jgi:hypothetical protein